jgi:hypothetical protein
LVRQRCDQVGQPGLAQHVPQFVLGCFGPGEEQVGPDGVVQQMPVLGDHAERAADRLAGQVADVQIGQSDRAGLHVVQPGK